MTRLSSCLAATGLCLFAACASSPPMRFYTLTPVAPATRLSAPPQTARLRLDRVLVPGELDRVQLVRRLDPTRLEISERDRWAAPLDEMIRRVLSVDLAARLPANLVADPNEQSTGEHRQSLSVDFQEFYADKACTITLRAVWILKPADVPGVQATEEVHIPAGESCSGMASQPAGMSEALAQLSDRIAAVVAGAGAATH